jgi:hypothetical protein
MGCVDDGLPCIYFAAEEQRKAVLGGSVRIDMQAHVPIECMSDYKQHILYMSVSLKTSRCISFTAVTGYGPVFCRVTIFLYVIHLRYFISHIWETQDMSSECETTAAVNLRKFIQD